MAINNRRLLFYTASALAILAAVAALSSHASAAAVDISFTLKDTDTTCRQWTPGQAAMWNFSLWMNGTDTSLITTPTYVWIDDSKAPAMQADSWVMILTASGNQLVNPPSYDSANSNELAIGSGVFTAGPQTLDVHLYASEHIPPAPPTNVTLQITPSEDSENKDHNFTVTATTHRQGVGTVIRKVNVCVHVPPKPRYDMGNFVQTLQSAANSDIRVSFWIKNVGNTQDWYYCNVSVPRDDWTWTFEQGINIGPNITNLTNIGQNLTIKVLVHVPERALAKENSTVSLNCTSIKDSSLFFYPPYTKIEVLQVFFMSASIIGDSTLSGIPGDQLRFLFQVQNRGNGPDHGIARIVAPTNLSWDSLVSPGDFDLGPFLEAHDSEEAQFLVTIPPNTVIFTYDFFVNVTSSANVTSNPITQLRFHVSVKQIYVPVVSPVAVEYGAPAQEIVFSFTIKNGGNGRDSLLIDVINLSDWRVFLSPPIGEKLLEVSEEAGFQATVIVPKDLTKAQVGSYPQLIRITSKYAQLDIGANIFVETNLTVVIRPRASCTLDPAETDKELNPYTFPDNIATANFILALANTGNGGDSISVSATFPEGFNVTLSPIHLPMAILETKAVLVSIVAPAELASGQYTIRVTARSDIITQANCTSEYRLDIFHLDASLSTNVQSTIQDPTDPGKDVPPIVTDRMTQVEGYFVKFRLTIQNAGQRAIAAGSLSFTVWDTFDCNGKEPVEAANNTCGTHQVYNWTNPTNIITGVGGSVPVNFTYFAPDYLCFDADVCHRTSPPPPVNAHHLVFRLAMKSEAVTSNNEASLSVEVLPRGVLVPPAVAAPFPVAIVAAGAGVAGLVGFAFWYRFVRKPKVDEDLYASIYGGGTAVPQAPSPQSQSVDQYFATQQGPQVDNRPAGMTDEQLEEARRMYGDSYGR